jgi:hypothetical protein
MVAAGVCAFELGLGKECDVDTLALLDLNNR